VLTEGRTTATVDTQWPSFSTPADLDEIESVPLATRGLPTSTFAVIERAARLWPDRTALTVLPSAGRWSEATRWSFLCLARQVRASANTFAEYGVGREDAVTLMSANTGLLLAATFAAQAAGIAAPVNPGLTEDRIIALMRATGSRTIVVSGPELDAQLWAKARSVAERHGDIDAIFALRPDAARGKAPHLESMRHTEVVYLCDEVSRRRDDALVPVPPSAESVASYIHTGGTTGDPKLAAHTHANEVAMAWMLAATSSLVDHSTILAGLPLFHVNALLVTGLSPLMRGHNTLWVGPAGYRDPVLFQNFWKIVEHFSVNAMSGVPTVYAVLSTIPVDADIHALQIAAVGAAPLPTAVRDQFRARTGIDLTEGYGLTEATCASAASRAGISRTGAVGLRLPYQHIAAGARADDDDRWHPLPPGSVGQLMISGPTVFPGYLVDGEVSGKGVLDGQWLLTGDLGCVDGDGFVFLKGRAKDLIIRGGHNIDPSTIEDAVLAHPAVAAVAAVGRPDIHSGEVPVVYVVADDSVSDDQLMDWAHDTITERAAVPKAIYRLAAIPTTAVGKPFKVPLREDAAVQALRSELENADVSVASITAEHLDGTLALTVYAVTDADVQAQIRAIAGAFSFSIEFAP
jgi:fatty-acyl-CoA synthase